MSTDPLRRLDAAIGPVATMSLEQRRLLPPGGRPPEVGAAVPADVDPTRRLAAVLGAAVGAMVGVPADGAAPGSAPPSLRSCIERTLKPAEVSVLSIGLESLADGAEVGGHELARRLADHRPDRRSPAVDEAVVRFRRGHPWFEAGGPSLGSAVLPRALAAGLRFGDDPTWRPVAACVDAAITHAHPEATCCAALTAEAVAWALAQPEGRLDPDALVEHLARCSWDPVVAAALRRLPSMADAPAELAATTLGAGATAQQALLTAVLALRRGGGDPEPSLLAVLELGGSTAAAATVAGAVLGGVHGVGWTEPLHDALHRLRRRLDPAGAALGLHLVWVPSGRVLPSSVTGGEPIADHWTCALVDAPAEPEATPAEPASSVASAAGGHVHIGFLLDTSGSMRHLVEDVVGGFNRFLVDQRALDHEDCTMTVVKFDTSDPFDVVVEGAPLADVPHLTSRTYRPRGGTPLYDAIDAMITSVDAHRAARRVAGFDVGNAVVVIFTDGLENSSQRASRSSVAARIKARTDDEDWTFVFMGANQDAYATGGAIGMVDGSTSGWRSTADGSRAAFASMSRGMSEYRGKEAHLRRQDKERFFGAIKEAEAADMADW